MDNVVENDKEHVEEEEEDHEENKVQNYCEYTKIMIRS